MISLAKRDEIVVREYYIINAFCHIEFDIEFVRHSHSLTRLTAGVRYIVNVTSRYTFTLFRRVIIKNYRIYSRVVVVYTVYI